MQFNLIEKYVIYIFKENKDFLSSLSLTVDQIKFR